VVERRLYFLIPDRAHALDVVDDLVKQGIDIAHIHAVADQHTRMDGLPGASSHNARTRNSRGRQLSWQINTACFVIALVAAILAPVFTGLSWWLLLPVGVMSVNFLTGLYLNNATNSYRSEFRDALAHGEILLLVDVPVLRAFEVEQDIQRQHPEATRSGIADWGTQAISL